MIFPTAKPAEQIEKAVNRYGDMLYRICYIMLNNHADAEDAVQETIIQYMRKAPEFENEEHEKAWLIRTARNRCVDIIRFRNRHPVADCETDKDCITETPNNELIDALMSLPEKYRTVLALYYVEGYSIDETAKIIKRTASAVKMRLQKGRKLLKEAYRKGQ